MLDYFIQIVDGIRTLSIVFLVFSAIIIFCGFVADFDFSFFKRGELTFYSIGFYVILVCILILIFVPSGELISKIVGDVI